MNIQPVHYAPHHLNHAPLCGIDKVSGGVLIGTIDRDLTTCFRCIDAYEERHMTPEQTAALTDVRDGINELLTELEELVEAEAAAIREQNRGAYRRGTLRLIEDLRRFTPWWDVRRRFILFRWRRHVLASA